MPSSISTPVTTLLDDRLTALTGLPTYPFSLVFPDTDILNPSLPIIIPNNLSFLRDKA